MSGTAVGTDRIDTAMLHEAEPASKDEGGETGVVSDPKTRIVDLRIHARSHSARIRSSQHVR